MTSAKIRNRRNSPRPAAETETANRSVLPCAGILRLIWLGRRAFLPCCVDGFGVGTWSGRACVGLACTHLPFRAERSGRKHCWKPASRVSSCQEADGPIQRGYHSEAPFRAFVDIMMASWLLLNCKRRCFTGGAYLQTAPTSTEGTKKYPCVCNHVFSARDSSTGFFCDIHR